VQSASDGADWKVQHRGDGFIIVPLNFTQHDDRAEIGVQARQGGLNLAYSFLLLNAFGRDAVSGNWLVAGIFTIGVDRLSRFLLSFFCNG
jgi:hypothetical protein